MVAVARSWGPCRRRSSLLYFLKLKRQPLEVPSTYLWHKSIEDLHVNTIWQRLRQNLLLFLQLCLIALVMLSLVRPSWMGSERRGDRSIFLIDNSASMGATDIEPTRLEYAKRQVEQRIDEMKSGDVAMIVSFADTRPGRTVVHRQSQRPAAAAGRDQANRPHHLAG